VQSVISETGIVIAYFRSETGVSGPATLPGAAWRVPWQFFGRFLCLDLLGTILVIPIVVPVAIATARGRTNTTQSVHLSAWVTVGAVIGAFVVDVALTFVVPALALNVRSVKESIRLGWGMTKAHGRLTPGICSLQESHSWL
jgi:hypothetical protein